MKLFCRSLCAAITLWAAVLTPMVQAAPVSYWALDDAAGSTSAANAIPLGPVATLVNMTPATAWTPGRFAGGLTFDGANDVIEAYLNISEAQNTTALWVRTAAPNGGFASVNKGTNLGENDRNIYFSGGNIYGRIWNEETINTSASGINFADGAWHHVAHVYGPSPDGPGKHLLYVDGVLRASGNKSTSNFNWQDVVRFGWTNFPGGANYLNGAIDEIVVYDEPLAANQIFALAQGAAPFVLPAASANSAARWTNGGAGEWATPTSWDINAIPGTTHDAYVNNGGTAQVTAVTGTAAVGALVVGGIGSGRVELQAGTLTAPIINLSNGGTLAVTGGTLTPALVAVSAGGTLDVGASQSILSLQGNGSVVVGSGATLTTGADNTSPVYSGTIAGAGGFTKTGTGYMTLGGASANTMAATTLDAGKLLLAKTAGVNAIGGNLVIAPTTGWDVGGVASNGVELRANEQIANTGVITFSGSDWSGFRTMGFTETVGGISCTNGRGVIENVGDGYGAATPDGTIIINNAVDQTYNGWIRNVGNTGSSKINLVKNGSGRLTLGVNPAQSNQSRIYYTGTTTINNGTLELVNLNAGSRFNSPVTVNGGGTLEINSTVPFATRWLYSPTLSGDGIVNKTGTGAFQLVGPVALTGTVTVQAGRLGSDSLTASYTSNTAAVNVSTGAELDLRGQPMTWGSLNGTGSVINSYGFGGMNVLTLGAADKSGSFSGTISGSGNGTGGDGQGLTGLRKIGSGTQTLGGYNTYRGSTVIDGGTLRVVNTVPYAPTAGSLIWLDATQTASFTMNGAGVAVWADRTGNGAQVAQTDPNRQPTVNPAGINGLQTVDFSVAGTADVLYNSTNYASPVSVFSIQQLTGGANFRLVTATSNNWLHGFWGGYMDRAWYNDGWVAGTDYPADNQPHMYNAVIRGGSANSDFYGFDPRNLSSVRLIASNTASRNGPNGLALGGWGTGAGEASNGRVGEILIYSGALSDAQRQQTEKYLAAKWFNYSDVIPDNSAVTIAGGAVLDLTNCVETIGSLSGAGNVVQTGGALNLNGAQAGAFTGNYTGGSAGLAKLGAAAQSMTGSVSYTGSTNVLQGDLTLGSSNAIGSTGSHFNIGTVGGQAASLTASGGTITAGPVVIGDYGTGTLNLTNTNLTANYNNYYGTLVLGLRGSGNGTMTQNGGTVTYNNGYMILGRYDSSRGTYNISAGTLTAGGSGDHNLYMGWDSANSRGDLNVSGTALVNVTGDLRMANQGTAAVVQTGGTVTVGGQLRLSDAAAGRSTYDISGGSLTVNSTAYIGINGQASLTVGGPSTQVTVNNGLLEIGYNSPGTVTQTGGVVTVNNSHIVLGRHASAIATYDISGGVLKTAGTGSGNRRLHMAWDNAASKAYFNLSGNAQVITNADNVGTGNATGFLVAEQGTAEINIRDSATLTINAINDNEGGFYIARRGNAKGTVNQTGGTVTVNDNWLLLGRYDNAEGTYNISGGVLKTAGTVNTNRRMHLGWDSATAKGTMNISGSAQVTTNADNSNPNNNGVGMFVGYNGTGRLTLADSAQLTINARNDPDGGLVVAWNGGASEYVQTGGTATLYDNYVMLGRSNAAQGTMTVTGGTFTQTGTAGDRNTYLGWNSALAKGILNVGGTGVVNLGADLNVGYDGTGAVTVSGGQLNVPGVVHLSSRGTSAASLDLNGGVLTAGGLNVGGGSGAVRFDGGTLRAGRDFSTAVPMTLNAGGGRIDTNGHTVDSIGVLSGGGGLTKAGVGTLNLSGQHTYGGPTVIEGGVLKMTPTPHQAYQIGSHAVTGAQSHNGSLGYDFRVLPGQSVVVTRLGFYDSQDNLGLAAAHDVFITDTSNTVSYASAVLAAGTGDMLSSGYRFVTLASPVTLGPGTYRVWGYNYALGDKDYNSNGTAPGPTDGGSAGAIAFGDGANNRGYWQNGNIFPTNADPSPAYRYGAVSFMFLDATPQSTLPGGTTVRVADGATWDLNGLNQTVAALGDPAVAGGTVELKGAVLTLNPSAGSTVFSGRLAGPGSLVKIGAGTQILNGEVGTSAYPVPVQVNEGVLGGTGPFSGPLTVGPMGIVSAGSSPGHLVVSGSPAYHDYDQDGTLRAEIGGYLQGLEYDWVEVTGRAALQGTIEIDWNDFFVGHGPFYVLTASEGIDITGAITIDDAEARYGQHAWQWSIENLGQGGQALRLDLVPEPASLLLLALGLPAAASRIRRRIRPASR